MNRVPVGIDLGTSNTAVFYKHNGVYTQLAFGSAKFLLPSVIEYRPREVIGDTAVKSLTGKDKFVLKNTKRVLGVKYDDVDENQRDSLCRMPMSKAPDGTVQFKHFGKKNGETTESEMIVTPVKVATDIIKDILERVRKATEMELGKLTVTFPATFKQEQRLALKEAILKAGVKKEDFRIVNEPTAAAISYAAGRNFTNEIILVYDLGGGTFDTTILQIEDGHFRVLAYDGDHNIGGVHFDHIVEKHLLEQIQRQFHRSPFHATDPNKLARQKAKFIKQCEEVKTFLSTAMTYSFSLADFAEGLNVDPNDPPVISCYQADITSWFQDTIQKTLQIVDRALKKANLWHKDISTVLFTGGSCQIKCIKDLVNGHFGRDICGDTTYAKESVAKGACIVSDSWMLHPDTLTLQIGNKTVYVDDITSTTLSFQTSPDGCCPFMYSGTKIDGKVIEFLLYDSNLDIGRTTYNFYEGNSTKIKECTYLKTYVIEYDKLRDVNRNGAVEYLFSFKVECDGIISLEIKNNVNKRVYLEREVISYFIVC